MKKTFTILGLICAVFTFAQVDYRESAVMRLAPSHSNGQAAQQVLSIQTKPQSAHGLLLDSLKTVLDIQRRETTGFSQKTTSFTPSVGNGFNTHIQIGVPNDNNVAISDSGMIVSVSNSSISVFDEQGNIKMAKSLAFFASGSITVGFPFDPHVLYDPAEDRFVVLFLDGSSSNNTKMVVAFSQTNDPTGAWNFYALPGNVHGDNTWSDYPFPALSNDELFISVLLWKNGESGWDSEATNELIWQIDKHKGYAGDSLVYKYYDSLTVNGRQVWNTRPIQGGSGLYGPHMYLLGNRAIDVQNDSIFLFTITNTMASGQAQLTTTILTAPDAYGIPPSAFQPDTQNVLRTNYADIHAGFLENDILHFVGNTIDTLYNSPGIYYGQISDPGGQPNLTTQIISTDTLDLNYPWIAYTGNSHFDASAMIMCLHSSPTTYPGTSVIYSDGKGGLSNLVRVKGGEGIINSMGSNIERWGDYTGMQRKYNAPGTVWLMGSYGKGDGIRPDNWVAEITNTDPALGGEEIQIEQSFQAYPNPVKGILQLKFDLLLEEEVAFKVMDVKGTVVWSASHTLQGPNKILVDLSGFPNGVYVVEAQGQNGGLDFREKVIVAH